MGSSARAKNPNLLLGVAVEFVKARGRLDYARGRMPIWTSSAPRPGFTTRAGANMLTFSRQCIVIRVAD